MASYVDNTDPLSGGIQRFDIGRYRLERIRRMAEHAATTYVIPNNHFQGKSVVNALQLIHMLTGNKVKVPEPLRHHYPQLEPLASEPSREPTLFPLPPR